MTTSPATARLLHGLTAAAAWLAVGLNVVLSLLGWYQESVPEGFLYGVNPAGWSGAGARLWDTLSYFTIWSNIVVAISSTQLALDPVRPTFARKTLRMSALLMITITALVYALVLAPSAHVVGWSLLTNPLAHIVVPALAVLGFLVAGPRRWVAPRILLASLAIPLVWVVFMLARGAAIGAYPYGFADVRTHGYATVMTNVAAVLAFGLAVAGLYALLDRLLSRRSNA